VAGVGAGWPRFKCSVKNPPMVVAIAANSATSETLVISTLWPQITPKAVFANGITIVLMIPYCVVLGILATYRAWRTKVFS